MDEIGLEYLSNSLNTSHVKLDLIFLKGLLVSASKSKSPHRNLEFAKLIGCPINKNKKSATTIYGWMKGYKTIPLSKISKMVDSSNFSWKDMENNLILIKSGIRRGEVNPTFPIQIDEKLGSLVGHILGDGSIDKRFHSVFYSNANKDLLQEFIEYIYTLFRIYPRIWVQKRKGFNEKSEWMKRVYDLNEVPEKHCVGLFCPKICCDILYAVCGKFAEGKNKKITKEIMIHNYNFKKGLLRAFFDDEGSVDSKNYTLRLYQDNKELLEDIKKILLEFDIKSNPIRSYLKRNKSRHYFNVTGYNNYKKFFDIIGCTSKKKKREFEILINKPSRLSTSSYSDSRT